jgi:hypothetical protein
LSSKYPRRRHPAQTKNGPSQERRLSSVDQNCAGSIAVSLLLVVIHFSGFDSVCVVLLWSRLSGPPGIKRIQVIHKLVSHRISLYQNQGTRSGRPAKKRAHLFMKLDDNAPFGVSSVTPKLEALSIIGRAPFVVQGLVSDAIHPSTGMSINMK